MGGETEVTGCILLCLQGVDPSPEAILGCVTGCVLIHSPDLFSPSDNPNDEDDSNGEDTD